MLKKLPLPLKVLLLAVSLIAIAALLYAMVFCAWLYFTGEHEWKTAQSDLSARGEKLAIVDFIPPPIPTDGTFFADPMWADLSDLVSVPGKSTLQPRLPEKQRAFEQGIPPCSVTEIDIVKKNFPDFKWPAISENRQDVLLAIWNARDRTPDGELAAARITLALLSPCQPFLDKVSALSLRSPGRAPVRYEDGYAASLGHISPLLRLSQLFLIQSRAQATAGAAEDAAASALTILRLAGMIEDENLLISFIARLKIIDTSLSAIDYGLRRHTWSEAQLITFDSALSGLHPSGSIPAALRLERAFAIDALTKVKSESLLISSSNDVVEMMVHDGSLPPLAPYFARFTLSSSKAALALTIQTWLDLFDTRPPYASLSSLIKVSTLALRQSSSLNTFRHSFAILILPSLHSVVETSYQTQASIDLTRLAIALERYRLAHGSYPSDLPALVPAYLPALPPDPFTDAPFHYTLKSSSEFLLYSVGRNLTDDSGTPGRVSRDGDLVWGYEPPKR